MRIALVGPGRPFRGGIAQHTELLAEALGGRHEVLLLGFRRQYPRWLFGGRSDREPAPSDRPSSHAERLIDPWNPLTWWRAAGRLATWEPDLLIIQWWVPFWALCFLALTSAYRRRAGRPAPVLYLCHNVLPHDGAGAAWRWLIRRVLGRADGCLVHSAADEAILRALLGLPRDKAPTAPEAGASRRSADRGVVRPQVFRGYLPLFALGRPCPPDLAREALAIEKAAEVVLFFGFVRPYKGLDLLLEAWPAVLRERPRARLLVVGEFWEPVADFRARAEALAVLDSLIIVDRYVPEEDLGTYFGAADLLALPYRSATGSAVLPLALHHGLPVVATAVGGLPDALAEGDCGLLVPAEDKASLAAALLRVLEDPQLRARLRAGAVARREALSWAGMVERIESAAKALGVPAPLD